MKKVYSKTERRGLPGGPNEFLQNITQYISVEGYKSDSPDVNNPFNIIESSNITMEDVNFPVMGTDNLGNTKMMMPGMNYKFPGDMVLEIPMAQEGGDPEMIFKDKYNTPLTEEEKIEYDAWVASESKRQGRDITMDLGAYDIQGFWKSGDYLKMDEDNHGSDKWKKPNHPTFSNQSKYHNIDGYIGGTWSEDGGYTPSDYTRQLYDKNYYDRLFGREPNRPEYLNLPKMQTAGETEGEKPIGTIPLDEVVITAPSKRNNKMTQEELYADAGIFDRGMPAYMRTGEDYVLSAEDQARLDDLGIKNIDDYNRIFGTDYSEDNPLNEYNYENFYKPRYDSMISDMHKAQLNAGLIATSPLMAIAAVELGIPALTMAGEATYSAAAPYVTSALGLDVGSGIGLTTGVTTGDAINLGFAADFLYNRAPEIPKDIAAGNYGDAALNTVIGALDLYGINKIPGAKITGPPVTPKPNVDISVDMTNLMKRNVTGTPKLLDVSDIRKVSSKVDDLLENNKNLDEVLELLARGADDIDDFIAMRLKTIAPGTEGYTRMNNMHKDYILRVADDQFGGSLEKLLKSVELNPKLSIDEVAQLMSNNRYAELENIAGNTINSAAKRMLADGLGDPSSKYYYIAKNMVKDKGAHLLKNASYYGFNPQAPDVVFDTARMNAKKAVDPNDAEMIMQVFGARTGKGGTIGIGPQFTSDPDVLRAVLDHEIAHAFSLSRDTPLAESLRYLRPRPGVAYHDPTFNVQSAVSDDAVRSGLYGDYDYFTRGNSKTFGMGDEPLAFAAELKRSMIDRGIINSYDDVITPDLLKQAYKSFSENPAGLLRYDDITNRNFSRPGTSINIDSGDYLSNTRLLDFTDPSQYEKLAGLLNRVPAVAAPIAVGSSLISEKETGGSVSWQWKGKTYSGTLIPSRETATHRYARTKNGKIKTLPKKEEGGNVSDIWQDVTGTPWVAAKEKGLTDGSFDQNLKLRSELLSDPNKFKPAPSNQLSPSNVPNASLSTLSPEEINDKINSANDFNSAFAIARSYYGPNKIFEYNSSKYGTNLKGEEFMPSNDDMINAGLRQQEVEDIKQQNELVASPYSSTDIVEIDEYENISDVKNRIKDYNKMSQADIIVNYQNQSGNTSPYVVVDKKAGLMHVYEPGNNPNEPRYSAPIDLGAVISDAQTVTKYKDLNQDGIISEDEISQDNVDWSAGNKSTGAGRYRISNIDRVGYMGKPIFNFINESGEDVGTSMHAGFVDDDNNRVSNGCIRCNQATLDVLTNYLENSSEVFVLPEEEGNKFVYENGQLNFKQGSGKDYLTYTDETGTEQRGQGLNRTSNTLNYIPIKIDIDEERFKSDQFQRFDFDDEEEYTNTVVPFAKSLEENKQLVMKNLKVNGDVYNDLAALAFGIFGNETGFGDTHSVPGNQLRLAQKVGSSFLDSVVDNLNLPDSLKIGPTGSVDYRTERGLNEALSKLGLANPDSSSMGLTQVRWNQIEKEPELVEALSSVGITQGRDFDDPAKAALGTVAILAYLRNNREGGNVPIEDLPRLYAGTSSTDPNRDAYTRNALNNAKYLNIRQKRYQKAGEVKDNPPIISDDVLLRQLFKESSFRSDATSSADARGIAQFRPITIKEMKRLGIVDDNFDPYDLNQAIPAQRAYMEYLSQRPQLTQGSDDSINSKILFAYNRGITGAVKELTDLKNKGVDIYDNTDWVDQINNESSDYINKIYLRNNEKFNKEFDSIIQNSKYNDVLKFFNKEVKMMGGNVKSMYDTYKHYVNGKYTDSDTLKEAQKVYDKVNRLNYRRAKEANMSIPNYVMTHVIGNS